MRDAEVLVVIMSLLKYDYKGTFTEIGIAIGRNIPIVMISPFQKPSDATCARNIYFHYQSFTRFATVTGFLEALDKKKGDE
jgi:hypothetical protein